MKKLPCIITAILFSAMFSSIVSGCCKKPLTDDTDSGNTLPSAADKISGKFNGTGKRLPDNVFLGNYRGCVTPSGWETNFITGPSVADISKVNDSTITLSLDGSPFPFYTYTNIKVEESGTRINFGFGYYDTDSKFLSLSRNNANSVFTGNPACLQGMPYYSGWSVLNDGNYGYYTHGRIDFSGTKE